MNDVARILKTERDKIFEIEAIMKKQPQIELEVVHYFSKGVYARELHIPAGVTLVGEIHKYQNLNILSQGEMAVSTEDGIKLVRAPFTVVSPPGTKRIAYTVTDCIWTTVHSTEEKDIDKIRNYFIAASEQEYLEFCGQQVLNLESKSDVN